MAMDEEKSVAIRDLEFIKQVMEETKKVTIGSNFIFIFWGLVIVTATALNYLLVFYRLWNYIPWIWWALMGVGVSYSAFFIWRESRRYELSTLSGRIMGYLWGSCLIGIGILTPFLAFYDYKLIMISVSVLVGIAVFVMGGIYGLKELKYLGISFGIGAVVMMPLPTWISPLIFGIFIGGGYLAAGYVLRQRQPKKGKDE